MNSTLQTKITNEIESSIGAPDYTESARQAYNAYGRTTNFKNYQGLAMPAWENLPDPIRVAWVAAVKQAVTSFVEGLAGDLGCFLRAFSRGEPTFTLIARDPTSFATILFWIQQNPGAPSSKLHEAFMKAERCREWPEKKAAD
jgi:hypothetical protein